MPCVLSVKKAGKYLFLKFWSKNKGEPQSLLNLHHFNGNSLQLANKKQAVLCGSGNFLVVVFRYYPTNTGVFFKFVALTYIKLAPFLPRNLFYLTFFPSVWSATCSSVLQLPK